MFLVLVIIVSSDRPDYDDYDAKFIGDAEEDEGEFNKR